MLYLEALANLGPRTTGIEGAVLWVSAGEYDPANTADGPRLLVVLGERLTTDTLKDSVSVTLTSPPRVLGTLPDPIATQVVEFIERNRDALLRHWHGEIGSKTVLNLISGFKPRA
jgi:hypothetical protein